MYKCYLCKKEYKQKGRLVRHLVSVHRKRMYDKETHEPIAEKLARKCHYVDYQMEEYAIDIGTRNAKK